MKSNRYALLAAASFLAAIAAAPYSVKADNQQPPGKQGDERDKKSHGREDRGGEQRHGQQGQEPRGPQGHEPRGPQQGERENRDRGERRQVNPAFGQQPPPNVQHKQFGNGGQGGNPNVFVKPNTPPPPKPPVVINPVAPQVQQPRDAGQQNFNKTFGDQESERHKHQKPSDRVDHNPAAPGNAPLQGNARPPGNAFPPGVNPPAFNKPANNFAPPPPRGPVLSPADAKRRFETLRSERKQVSIDGGKGVVIEEPGKRRIFRENNRVFIQHDDNERLRRVAPNARFEKGKGGTNIAVIDRPGGYRIYSETDANGQLIRRYRRGPDGRDEYIIDNRRRRDKFGRYIAAGVGIGIGAAILGAVLDVPPPRISIPRDEYIVDYDRASDDDIYDALSAPPVEEFRERYTLDEIRATAALRDRMRRIDLDDITFDFGSWEIDPSQYGKLDRIARAMKRIIDRHPDEVFMIEGYTDAVGTPEDNLSLSDRRAESVAAILTEQFQIPFENLTTQGYGEDYLKVPTQGPERLNRRVAVRRITPLLARGGSGGPPPPPASGEPQRSYDDGQGGPDNGGPDDGGPDDRGPDGPQDGGPGYDGPQPRN